MLKCLHLCSAEDDARNQAARETPAYDELGQIKPVYSQIVQACKENYHPQQEISINERMVSTKTRGIQTQPEYKLFVMIESATGYTWNMYISTATSKKRLSYESVMNLLDTNALGTGYHVYVDDFYTSSQLFRDLLAKRTGVCGTRHNKMDQRRRPAVRKVERPTRSHDVFNDTSSVQRRDRFQARQTRRRRVQVDLPVPTPVKAHDEFMREVDASDAVIGYHKVSHKAKKWFRFLFYHFVDIAVVNSLVLYNEANKDDTLTKIEFNESLISGLAKRGSGSTSAVRETPRPVSEKITHYLVYLTEGEPAGLDGQTRCRKCQRETAVGCKTCQVPLCFLPERNCYAAWHD
ncbi:hypothetical protein WMY93_008373 [Mugilogobius chulae]|uniref:PiggyBac transposable element-derived protein domain-containing protein n=1 Tax=Mugilogobius chulae TaxID=88201 RepID=A0AAW0PJ35_9GOBI